MSDDQPDDLAVLRHLLVLCLLGLPVVALVALALP